MYYVYTLLLENGHYYVGCTSKLVRRIGAHKCPSGRKVKTLCGVEIHHGTKEEALDREKEVQKMMKRFAMQERGLLVKQPATN